MAGDTDKCQICQMPPQPHHRCANSDTPSFWVFLLRSFVGKMETWSANDKAKVLVSGQVGRMDVTTLNEQPAWRNGADMGYVLIMHRAWMHSDTQALAQAQFQHEQSFPHPYGHPTYGQHGLESHPYTVYQNNHDFQAAVPMAPTRGPTFDTDGDMISVGWWCNNKWSQKPTAIQT